jgi:hypothetical protein
METTIQFGFITFVPRNERGEIEERAESVAAKPIAAAKGPACYGRLQSHPLWIRIEQALFDALAPFADARRAVAQALSEVEPEPESPS